MSFPRAGLSPMEKKRLGMQSSLSGGTTKEGAATYSSLPHMDSDASLNASRSMEHQRRMAGHVSSSLVVEGPDDTTRKGRAVQRNPAHLKDHISSYMPRDSARVKATINHGKRTYHGDERVRSAFTETPAQVAPKRRVVLRATPWAQDVVSARRVVPSERPVFHKRKKAIEGHAPGQETVQVERPRRVPAHDPNAESKPAEPAQPRNPDRPVASKYRSTPGLLKFSPRISSMTPRKKTAWISQRSSILSYVEAPAVVRQKRAPPVAETTQKASLDSPKFRAKKHVPPAHQNPAGHGVFGPPITDVHRSKGLPSSQTVAHAREPVGRGSSGVFGPPAEEKPVHFSKRMSTTGATFASPTKSSTAAAASASSASPNASRMNGSTGGGRPSSGGGLPWATNCARSPFDPGSARGVKPFSSLRRHVDPNA